MDVAVSMTENWEFVTVAPMAKRNDDASATMEFSKRDLENAVRYPYVARLVAFNEKDLQRREHSPINRRKRRTVIMQQSERFHYYAVHFAGATYEELERQLSEHLEIEMRRRNANRVELIIGKFITQFDCVGLQCSLDTKNDLVYQLDAVGRYYEQNMPRAQALLPYRGRGIAKF